MTYLITASHSSWKFQSNCGHKSRTNCSHKFHLVLSTINSQQMHAIPDFNVIPKEGNFLSCLPTLNQNKCGSWNFRLKCAKTFSPVFKMKLVLWYSCLQKPCIWFFCDVSPSRTCAYDGEMESSKYIPGRGRKFLGWCWNFCGGTSTYITIPCLEPGKWVPWQYQRKCRRNGYSGMVMYDKQHPTLLSI